MKSDYFSESPAFTDFQTKLAQEFARLYAEIDKKNLTIKALTEERDEVVRMANKLTKNNEQPPKQFKLDRLEMHQEWFDKNHDMVFLAARVVMQELLAMCRQYRIERDHARQDICNNKANHLPTMADPRMEAKRRGWDCFKEDKQ